jgi:hypothetical protein
VIDTLLLSNYILNIYLNLLLESPVPAFGVSNMRPALTPLILSIYKVAVHASAAGKQIVLDEVDFSTREKVPGENSAYFTGPPNLDQFFTILDLRVSPNPPQM